MLKVKKSKFEGIFWIGKKLATVNLVPSQKVYGEELIKIERIEYRIWDIWRSKPAAAIFKGIRFFPITKGMKILYLGIASGTTGSHFSDIVNKEGVIYGVEISERVLRELIPRAEKRGNIITILGDARKPEEYEGTVEKVNLVYEDVADPAQIKILIWNCEKFLEKNGYAMIAIKSQSIDVIKDPKEVYKEAIKEFSKHFDILDKVELDPFDKGHMFLVMKFKH